MLEALVIGRYPRAPNRKLNLAPDGIVHHRGGNRRPLPEAGGKVCRDIVFASRYMETVFVSLRKRNNARIKPGYQRSQRQ